MILNFDEFINESKGFSTNIKVLSDYIYKLLYDYANMGNPDESEETQLYLDYLEAKEDDDDFIIPINFDDIKGFDNSVYKLATYKRPYIDYEKTSFGGEDFDMQICLDPTLKGINLGAMESSEPTLFLKPLMFKTLKTLKKNQTQIKNTITHEITHYIQSMANIGDDNARPSTANDTNLSYQFQKAVQGVRKYSDVNQVTYMLDKNEIQARIQGFAQTAYDVIDKMYEKYIKKHKKFDLEDFAQVVLNDKSFDQYDLHIQYIQEFIDMIKDDNWEKISECANDTSNPYRDDSVIYVMLRCFENRPMRSTLPLPGKSKDKLVSGLQTKDVFNKYKEKLYKYTITDFDNYKKKILNIIKYICQEKGYDQ